MNQLEQNGYLLRGTPRRGKIGQPSIPLRLNPDGAFAYGFKIGRRSAALALMDMVGGVRRAIRTTYAYPERDALMRFLESGLADFEKELTPEQRSRISGIGIAEPSEMWSWEAEFGAPAEVVRTWRDVDMRADVETRTGLPAHSYNDATAACAAELAFGRGREYSDFFYIFFATLVGGGLVLDGSLYPGRHGYAGAIGSVPVPTPEGPRSLIQCASLSLLERAVRAEGGNAASLWTNPDDWSAFGQVVEAWIERTSDYLAWAVIAAISIIDFPCVVVDGAFPVTVRADLVERTHRKVARNKPQGVAPVEVVAGSVGADARVLGAASLPLLANFALDRDVLFNDVDSENKRNSGWRRQC